MVELVNIPAEDVNEAWHHVEGDIKSALERSGNYANTNHFKNWLKQGIAQLWILWDKDVDIKEKYHGVVITELIHRPLIKVCNIRIMVGKDRQKWQHHIKIIEEFAKSNGCDKMELIARPGWEKVLHQYNYYKSHVVLDKYLKEK